MSQPASLLVYSVQRTSTLKFKTIKLVIKREPGGPGKPEVDDWGEE